MEDNSHFKHLSPNLMKGAASQIRKKTGFNFTNVLQAAFMCTDPESTNKTAKLSVFFALSGSAGAKAPCRMLMELAPGF